MFALRITSSLADITKIGTENRFLRMCYVGQTKAKISSYIGETDSIGDGNEMFFPPKNFVTVSSGQLERET